MKNNLKARINAWDELKSEGGNDRTKMIRMGGKLAAFHRPGSQKK